MLCGRSKLEEEEQRVLSLEWSICNLNGWGGRILREGNN